MPSLAIRKKLILKFSKKPKAYRLVLRHLAFNLYRQNMALSCVIVTEDAVIFIGSKPIITGGRSYNCGLTAKAWLSTLKGKKMPFQAVVCCVGAPRGMLTNLAPVAVAIE